MATVLENRKVSREGATPIPRALRRKVEELLLQSFAFMDSPIFRRKRIEKELFDFEVEPQLPMTSWYQPTRDEAVTVSIAGAPQLMKTQEERLMFLRFNYCKLRLSRLQKLIAKDGLTRERADQFVEWHRRFEHFREYLVRTNLALVLAMAKRTRLGDVDFAEIVSEGNMALIRAVDKFNVDRGFKFSTYACRAILKAFSRTSLKSGSTPHAIPRRVRAGDGKERLAGSPARCCRGRLHRRAAGDCRSQPGRSLERGRDGDPPSIQLAAAGRKPADAGRSRADHRRDERARSDRFRTRR